MKAILSALAVLLLSTLPSQAVRAGDEARPEDTTNTIAWGKAVKGLQAGLRYSGPKSAFALGEAASFEVVVRNVSDEAIQVSYVEPSAFLGMLKEGNQLALCPIGIGKGFETTRTLQPGKEVLFSVSLLLLPPGHASPARPWLEIEAGKYRVSSPGVLLRRDGSDSKLGTGVVELKVLQPEKRKNP